MDIDNPPTWNGQQSQVELRPYTARVLRRLGQAIRIERGRARCTAEDLASLTGLSTSTLSRFERGERPPRFDQLVVIANALNISVFRLIEGADDRACPVCHEGRISHWLACSTNGIVRRLGIRDTVPALEDGR